MADWSWTTGRAADTSVASIGWFSGFEATGAAGAVDGARARDAADDMPVEVTAGIPADVAAP
jgi:hypothetical protein